MIEIFIALVECLSKLFTVLFETLLGSHIAGVMVVIFGIMIFAYKLLKRI